MLENNMTLYFNIKSIVYSMLLWIMCVANIDECVMCRNCTCVSYISSYCTCVSCFSSYFTCVSCFSSYCTRFSYISSYCTYVLFYHQIAHVSAIYHHIAHTLAVYNPKIHVSAVYHVMMLQFSSYLETWKTNQNKPAGNSRVFVFSSVVCDFQCC